MIDLDLPHVVEGALQRDERPQRTPRGAGQTDQQRPPLPEMSPGLFSDLSPTTGMWLIAASTMLFLQVGAAVQDEAEDGRRREEQREDRQQSDVGEERGVAPRVDAATRRGCTPIDGSALRSIIRSLVVHAMATSSPPAIVSDPAIFSDRVRVQSIGARPAQPARRSPD